MYYDIKFINIEKITLRQLRSNFKRKQYLTIYIDKQFNFSCSKYGAMPLYTIPIIMLT